MTRVKIFLVAKNICIWADADEGHRFEGWEQALGRCRCALIIIIGIPGSK